jgi:Uma2 family endonuclease
MREEDAMPTAARSDARLTYNDFLRFPEDGTRHELINGVHYVTASPGLGHQELLGRLYLAIGNFLVGRRHLGRVFPRLMELSTGRAQQLETPLLPGFALSIDDLFAPI